MDPTSVFLLFLKWSHTEWKLHPCLAFHFHWMVLLWVYHHRQADLRDTVVLVPEHGNKANIARK